VSGQRLKPIARAMLALSCAALVAATPYQVLQAHPTNSYDRGPNGLFAFGKWLKEIGFSPQRVERVDLTSEFELPLDTRVLIMMSPAREISRRDADLVERFVWDGGTLIYSSRAKMLALDNAFGVRSTEVVTWTSPHTIVRPVAGITQPATIRCEAFGYVEPLAGGRAVGPEILLSVVGNTTAVSLGHGKGRVVALTAPCILTNAILADGNDARVARSLLGDAPAGSVVVFDEYHPFAQPGIFIEDSSDFAPGGLRQGAQESGPPPYRQAVPAPAPGYGSSDRLPTTSPRLRPPDFSLNLNDMPLFSTPWGAAILLALFTLMVYTAANGRRLGREMPLARDIRPRNGGEYVVAIASLHERAGHGAEVQEHLLRRLERALGSPLGIDHNASDAGFAAQVAAARPDIDPGPLTSLIDALQAPSPRPESLPALAAEVNQIIERYR
jgi:hypothetical protein